MSVIVEPGRTFLDNSGRVLSSGTVTFYVAGQTVTKKAIYATAAHQAAGTPALSNPQTLTSAGRLTTQVHGPGLYRMIVKNSLGATILDEDNVAATPEPDVSVTQFGADPTGVADSYAAFVAALSSLGSSGGIVRVPKGIFKLATALQLPQMDETDGAIRIIGEGPWSTRINFTGTGYAFTMGDGGASESFFNELHDFALYGTSSADGGVKMNGTYFAMINRVYMRDFTKAAARGVYGNTKANYHATILHSSFRNIPTGVYLEGSGGIGANSNTIWRSWFGVHSGEAIHIDAVSANVIQDNEFNGSTTTAIRISNNADGNKILFNQFDGPTNKVVFTTNTAPRTQIIGNTGGDGTTTGLIVGRGTNSFIVDPTTTPTIWGADGVIIGDADNPATNAVPLTVRGVASLGTYSFVVENSASSYLFRVNQAGATEAKTTINSHGKLTVQNDVSNNSTLVLVDNATGTTSAANILMEMKGHASQSGDALQVQTSAGTVLGGITATGAGLFVEQSDPTAPAANRALLYAKDNGAGKTQLVVRFPTGAVQVLATEP